MDLRFLLLDRSGSVVWLAGKILSGLYELVLHLKHQGTKIFQHCTCPAGRVTYYFHLFCKDMHLTF